MSVTTSEHELIPEDIALIAKLRIAGLEQPTNIYFDYAHRYNDARVKYSLKETRRALLIWEEGIRANYSYEEAERILRESWIARRMRDALTVYHITKRR